jgi:hypothetical protein
VVGLEEAAGKEGRSVAMPGEEEAPRAEGRGGEVIHQYDVQACHSLSLVGGAREPHLHAKPHHRSNIGLDDKKFDSRTRVWVA